MDWLFFKTFLSLGLVIGLIVVVLYLMKKFLYGGRAANIASGNMKLLGHLAIQPKKVIYLVKVVDKVFVVGVAENSMQMLGEINNPELLRHMDENVGKSVPAAPKKFSDYLKSVISS
jgi:flagellar biosynthetic protein FliO